MPRTTLALDFPLGHPVVPAVLTRRRRLLPPGVATLVAAGDHLRAEQPLAELSDGSRRQVLPAGLAGRVVESQGGPRQAYVTVEGVVTLLHGIMGVGGQVAGALALLPRGESLAVVQIAPGAVIIFPHQVPLMLMQRAVASGAAGIIAGSASARELEAFARTDLTAALDGQPSYASLTPLTVVLTEGVGSASMSTSTYQLLSQRVHDTVLLDGATDPRRNLRPEVILSAPPGVAPQPAPADATIRKGAVVSVSAGPRRGARGTILHIFETAQPNAAGLRVPSASVRLEDGSMATLPLHALDRVG
jgi:hypothetical protein